MNATTQTDVLATPAPQGKQIYLRRRASGVIGWTLTTTAIGLLAFVLLYLLGFVLVRGLQALHPDIFLTDTQGIAGGLRNAIVGSLLISGGGVLLAAPVGICAGIFLAEYGDGWLGRTGRFMSDVLVGVPSIVLGYFGYITMVLYLGWKFSLAAGALTLAIMMLPYIARTSEMALRQVPLSAREAAYGLGCGEGRVIWSILMPAARGPIITGVLLALAISLGETAPLLYTAGWSNYLWSGQLTHEGVGYLTYVIWSFIGEPYASAHQLAYAAALLITLMVLAINLIARALFYRRP
ncbi:phosphate ABC transporter, permease protein PstA [Acidihalobacter yilgarnensis]|uniref:Phosphate transport system permease protein PstA n=1 Tax=Acidihalobacter yilgarnensis TaxID=2819280 RepID=A0A1D8IKA2_9GAMM|nr:phosphate ABC transporter permease PstA [Acidihalobacter yilgarnensis]AOU96821.1 phosphate ABC transporter, permease protein PstA [Acidihalobacter yilgarnensis]